MKNANTGRLGFTLIELLVVVLIIGILAAVALPQYRKAVEKSRASEALSNIRTLDIAEKVYKLANGNPTDKLDSLDVAIDGEYQTDGTLKTHYFTYDIHLYGGTNSEGYEIIARRNHNDSNGKKYYIYKSYISTIYCVTTHDDANAICTSLCHVKKLENQGSGSGKQCVIPRG